MKKGKKKKEFRRLEIISIIFVSLIIFFFAWTIFSQKQEACTEEAKVCNDGTVVVREGENCEFAPCPDVVENRIYCTSEDRESDICTFLYDPVCGYFNPEKIKCVQAPCASQYPNSCIACSDEAVEYWVSGVC